MKIKFVSRSKFLTDCETAIQRNAADLEQGRTLRVTLAGGGYAGQVAVTIRQGEQDSLDSDWVGTDVTRFPVRMRAAATALRNCRVYGHFVLTHDDVDVGQPAGEIACRPNYNTVFVPRASERWRLLTSCLLEGIAMNPTVSVRDLRRGWKVHKARLNEDARGKVTLIRFHRACSWLARVEALSENDDLDLALVSLWIAFNSLYGQWDCVQQEPLPDRECWRHFIERMLALDAGRQTIGVLQTHKPLVLALVADDCLSSYCWRHPDMNGNGHARRMRVSAQNWYRAEQWIAILDEVLDRIYLMRCQLVHGAATYGGKLNRTSLGHCVGMLRHLILAFLQVWIDDGSDEDWGIMCYPPLPSNSRNQSQPRLPR